MKLRAHSCQKCGNLWVAPVRLSKNAVGISGEAAVYCPLCLTRAAFSGPAQEFTDLENILHTTDPSYTKK